MLRRLAAISLRQGLPTFGGRVTFVRNATRFTSRTPIAVVNKDEVFDPEYIDLEPNHIVKETHHSSKPRGTKNTQQEHVETETKQQKCTVKSYTMLKNSEQFVTSLMMKVTVRKQRMKHKLIALEGSRLINDAVHAGVALKMILFSKMASLEAISIPEHTKLFKVPYRTIQLWSNLTTSPGVIGIFHIPNMKHLKPANDALPLTVVCDNIREPGNLGSILRAAAAVGCEKLVLLKGCADIWDPKVLRSACGAHFRLPIYDSQHWEDVPSFISADSRIFLADNNNTCDIDASKPEQRVTQEIDDDDALEPRMELNVLSVGENATEERKSLVKRQHVKTFLRKFPVVPYYSLDYTERESVLVISGETEDLSSDCCKFLDTRDFLRVNIPMTNGVESLNNGMALGIVAFEIKRQFLNKPIN